MKTTNEQQLLARVLRQLANALSGLSPDDFEALRKGNLKVALVPGARSSKHKVQERSGALEDGQLKDIVSQLNSFHDRESGLALLNDRCNTKARLEQVARSLDLPVQRKDNAHRLRGKVVEATIGYRLRSEVIRGKGGHNP